MKLIILIFLIFVAVIMREQIKSFIQKMAKKKLGIGCMDTITGKGTNTIIQRSSSGTCKVNGKSYTGSNITVVNGTVLVDGVSCENSVQKAIHIEVIGNVETIDTAAGNVECQNAGSIETVSGNVRAGNVGGDIDTVSGDVNCGNVRGNVDTVSGNVR